MLLKAVYWGLSEQARLFWGGYWESWAADARLDVVAEDLAVALSAALAEALATLAASGHFSE